MRNGERDRRTERQRHVGGRFLGKRDRLLQLSGSTFPISLSLFQSRMGRGEEDERPPRVLIQDVEHFLQRGMERHSRSLGPSSADEISL
jgi:hypothetical protein